MDAHERTRAILWCLADLDPGMPLIEALGYLRAVEHEVGQADRAARAMREPYGASFRTAEDLALAMSAVPGIAARARAGDAAGAADAIRRSAVGVPAAMAVEAGVILAEAARTRTRTRRIAPRAAET